MLRVYRPPADMDAETFNAITGQRVIDFLERTSPKSLPALMLLLENEATAVPILQAIAAAFAVGCQTGIESG